MPKLFITKQLLREIEKTFKKQEQTIIFKHIESLQEQPRKGKTLGTVEGIVIKELKYKKYRFYFLTDGHKIKLGTPDELVNIIIKFVRMSDKKNQQQIINEIKDIIKSLGFEAF